MSELINALAGLSNSQAIGSDGLNPTIIKKAFPVISNQLLYIFNLSFNQGVYPDMLKNAIITPVFKSGIQDDPSNYRPISILTIFSKLLEKIFYNRLLIFINKNTILHSNQFGFRPRMSNCTCYF
jgi:hypothetical protein